MRNGQMAIREVVDGALDFGAYNEATAACTVSYRDATQHGTFRLGREHAILARGLQISVDIPPILGPTRM